MVGAALAACLLATVLPAGAVEEPPLPEVARALDRIAGRSSVEITTVGRRTGREHTRPIWFVVSDGRILVQAGRDGRTDWYRNLEKTPLARVRQGDYVFRVRATPVTDEAEVARVHRLFLDKYARAWFLSFFGSSIGRGRPVVLEPLSVTVRRDDPR